MTDELTILENDNTNQEISQVIYKKPVSLTFARITVCTGLITGLLFLRVGNNKLFKDVSCCYKKAFCYESENASKKLHNRLANKLLFFKVRLHPQRNPLRINNSESTRFPCNKKTAPRPNQIGPQG